jgi:diguanylate cyclase (GGDEF)-like protein
MADPLDTRVLRPSVARDRPEGQSAPLPHMQLALQMRVKAVAWSALASGILLAALTCAVYWTEPRSAPASLIIILALASIAAPIFQLQIALKQELGFEILIAILAVGLLPPIWGIPVIVLGYLVGYGLRYHLRFEVDCPFNAGVYAIALALAYLAGRAAHLTPLSESASFPRILAAGLLIAVVHILTVRISVAYVVHLQSGLRWLQVLRDGTIETQAAEQAMLGAMTALGIAGLLIAHESAPALLLLVLPAFAMWHALRQHVETRHRIEASLETAQRVARIGTLDWDLARGDTRWSDILYEILGYDSESNQASTDAYLARVASSDRDLVAQQFINAANGAEFELDHRIELPGGEIRSLNLTFNNVLDRRRQPRRIVATVHDITDRKLLEDRLQFEAFHDALTGLPNRAMFRNRLDQSFARYGRTGSIALLFLDLDRFKLINDTLGHDAGDQLLRIAAQRVQSCVRPNDLVARLGGDEFTVLLDAVDSTDEAIAVASRIIRELSVPIRLAAGREVHVSTSVGIVRPTAVHLTSDDFLRDADVALYSAKENGRGRYALFEPNMSEANRFRLDLEEDIRTAFDRNEFTVVYQPRFDLRTAGIAMLEALIRWNHPTRGQVPPRQFIPIVEEIGLTDNLFRTTLDAVLADLRTWHKLPATLPPVSLNVTARQLALDNLIPLIRDRLSVDDLPAALLRIEVPESAIAANGQQTITTLGQLREMGINASIDDFGTGHASLSALTRVPIDMLQIDQTLVAELGQADEARTIAQAVISLAHGLNVRVTAEGIEHPDQLQLLRALGCDLGQGYLFQAAVPITDPAGFEAALPDVRAMLGNDIVLSEMGPRVAPRVDS